MSPAREGRHGNGKPCISSAEKTYDKPLATGACKLIFTVFLCKEHSVLIRLAIEMSINTRPVSIIVIYSSNIGDLDGSMHRYRHRRAEMTGEERTTLGRTRLLNCQETFKDTQ